MTLKTRRLIAISFVLVFFLTAPLVLLYSLGYRFNFQTVSFQKTGSVLVVSQPRGATIYLSGKKLFDTTPAHINSLLPGKYTLKLEKAGYQSWSRTILVQSGRSTFAEGIVLFAESEPQKLSEEKISWIDFSPRNNYALFTVENEKKNPLYLLDLDSAKTTLLKDDFRAKNQIQTNWSPDAAKCLLTVDDEKQFIVSTSIIGTTIEDITSLVTENKFSRLQWDAQSDSLFYGLAGNSIFKIDTFLERTLTAKKIFERPELKNGFEYRLTGNELLLLSAEKNNALLEKIVLSGTAEKEIPEPLPIADCASPRFAGYFADTTLVQCPMKKAFYFIDTNNVVRQLETGFDGALIHPSQTKILLFTEDKTLAIEQTASGWMKFFSESKDAKSDGYRWHTSTKYLFRLNGEKLEAVETDTGLAWTIAEGDITSFSANTRANDMYFMKDGYLWQTKIYSSFF